MREAAQAAGNKPRYDGRAATSTCPSATIPTGSSASRTRLPATSSFDDKVKGRIDWSNTELDDLVLIRSDGFPTYNFAVVVDDLDMKITDVIRGDDHVNNTPRQINIYDALGAPVPAFAHLPMILGADGAKLSPSATGAVGVMQYRDDGYLPHALLNYLVRLGWSHGDQEIFSIEEMTRAVPDRGRQPFGVALRHRQARLAQPAIPEERRSGRCRQTPGVAPAQRRLRPRQRPRAGRCRDRAARPRADAQGNGRSARRSGIARSSITTKRPSPSI